MQGTLLNFRQGRHTKHDYQMLLKIDGIDAREKAAEFVGYTVIWQCPGKKKKVIKGIITSLHGNKGCLRVRFEKGMPGQAISTKVKIEPSKKSA